MHLNNARQAVLQTAELLEEIFLYLPVIDLWRAQRVSKQFLGLTKTSPKIKSAMLLTPDSGLPRPCWKPCLNRDSSTWETVVSSHAEQSSWTSGWPEKKRTPAQLAPMLKLRKDQMMRPDDLAHRTNSAWRLQYWADEQCPIDTETPRKRVRSVSGYCKRQNDAGIQVGEMLRSPLNLAAGMEWWDDGRYFRKADVVPSQIIGKVEEKFRCKAELDTERSWFILNGMVVPRQEEWQTVPKNVES
ncbi:hypothetical protein AC579_8688 [Pseudocercospora musae]|uniref:F-box domain-containing protein n=1 Tax=Pseudocercospora musae TaxID=113226 RepID=A0A139I0S6_9PEZI|nr:hypothetical protein AC579_8688 [Pseudocercospora musae]